MNYDEFDRRLGHAEVLLDQSRYKEADKILSSLLLTEHMLKDVGKLSVMAKIGLNKINEAKDVCSQILHRFPTDAYLLYLASFIDTELKNYASARSYIRKAIYYEATNDHYFAHLSKIELLSQNYDEAIKIANHTLSLHSKNEDALFTKAVALYDSDQIENSKHVLEETLTLNPNNPNVKNLLGWIFLNRGNHKMALQLFQETLAIEPNHHNAAEGLQTAVKANFPLYRYAHQILSFCGKKGVLGIWVLAVVAYILSTYYSEYLPSITNHIFVKILVLGLGGLLILFSLMQTHITQLILWSHPLGANILSKREKQKISIAILYFGLFIFFVVVYVFIIKIEAFLWLGIISMGSLLNHHISSSKDDTKLHQRYNMINSSLILLGIVGVYSGHYHLGFPNTILWMWLISSLIIKVYYHYKITINKELISKIKRKAT